MQPPGWGTDHPGTGKCKLHGGSNTGPKDTSKSKYNGVKHGAHTAMWYDMLTEEEKAAYHEEDTDVIKQLVDEIRLTSIRETRMLERIRKLAEEAYTLVGYKAEGTDWYRDFEDFRASMLDRGKSVRLKRDVQEEWTGTLGQIIVVENALTVVQDKKAKLLDLKHRIELTNGPKGDGKENLKAYADALNTTAEDVWAGEEGGDDGTEE